MEKTDKGLPLFKIARILIGIVAVAGFLFGLFVAGIAYSFVCALFFLVVAFPYIIFILVVIAVINAIQRNKNSKENKE